jgi:hypothetical protein
LLAPFVGGSPRLRYIWAGRDGLKARPCPLTVRAHHGARPCWRKCTC